MNGGGALALSIAMIAALLLMGGGCYLILTVRDYKKGGLMLVAALVMIANVPIWTI